MKVHRSPIYNIRFRVSKISDPVWIGWAPSFCMHEALSEGDQAKGIPANREWSGCGRRGKSSTNSCGLKWCFYHPLLPGVGGSGLHVLHAVIWDPTDTREYKCHYQKLLFFFNTCNALMILILVFSLCANLSKLSFGAWWTMKFQQVHLSATFDFSHSFQSKLFMDVTWPLWLERANNYYQ